MVGFWSCGEAPSGWDGAIISPDGEIAVDAGGSDNEEEGGDNEEDQPLGIFESNYSDIYASTFEALSFSTSAYTSSVSNINITELSSCINSERLFEAGNFSIRYRGVTNWSEYYESLGLSDSFYDTNIQGSFEEAIIDENNECILNIFQSYSINYSDPETEDVSLNYTYRMKIRFDSDFTKSEIIYNESEGQWIENENFELNNVGDCQ